MASVEDRFDYDDNATSVRIHQPSDISHVRLRGRYSFREKPQEDNLESLGSLIDGPLIRVRGEELFRKFAEGKYKTAVRKYQESGSLDNAARACPYLRDDFHISPYLARSIFSYAIAKAGIKVSNGHLKKIKRKKVEKK